MSFLTGSIQLEYLSKIQRSKLIIFLSKSIKHTKALGILERSSPYFILDVLFRVKSPKTTYTRIYGCYSGLLGGSRIRSMEWFVDVCSNEK